MKNPINPAHLAWFAARGFTRFGANEGGGPESYWTGRSDGGFFVLIGVCNDGGHNHGSWGADVYQREQDFLDGRPSAYQFEDSSFNALYRQLEEHGLACSPRTGGAA